MEIKYFRPKNNKPSLSVNFFSSTLPGFLLSDGYQAEQSIIIVRLNESDNKAIFVKGKFLV